MGANEVNKKYELGYCMGAFSPEQIEKYGWLKEKADLCVRFILGIPDEWVMGRLFGDSSQYNAIEAKQHWMDTGWFSDVLIIDAKHLSYQKIYEDIHFDLCFYGTEYGMLFEQDKKFMAEHKVSFVSLMPERYISVWGGGSIKLAIDNLQREQRIVLFGTGLYFDTYMNIFGKKKKKYLPAYAIDNDPDKWNKEKQGIQIMPPSVIQEEKEEDILVVVCSKKSDEMVQQLKEWGDFNYRTLRFENEISSLEEFAIISAGEREYLKKSHEVLRVLMAEFDRVCQKNHLHYYVICGSLIGVVRHRDIIPWDDDIDIAMPRKDYKKLRKVARQEWNNSTFRFLHYTDIGGNAFLDCMPRLFYMKERLPMKCFDKVHGKANAELEDRAFLDIYVMDNAHENNVVHSITINIMKGIYNLMMGHRVSVDYDEYRIAIPEKTIVLMKCLHTVGRIFPIRFLAFWYDFFARSANLNPGCKNYIMESCAIRCIELKYPKEHFGEGLRLPFADMEVMVPSDYDAQLKAMRYWNYMEFPRMSIRKPSHYFNSDIEIW